MSAEATQKTQEAAVDVSKLSEEEKAVYEKYGRVPKRNEILKKRNDRLRGGNQKFDSADWEMKKNQEKKG